MTDVPSPSCSRRPGIGSARAAVENGADAVYFGLATPKCFNARARAKNFTPEELPELIAWLHQRGVKGYVAVNTLVFPRELEEVERLLRRIAEAGADAMIVQDLGVARLARELCPGLPLHASTQMTLSSAEAIRMVEPLGIRRVILPRELSIGEIRRIRAGTGVELEVFVHGALCLAYSGQCLASRTLGGRSGNRGECAQPCRMPYQVVCDGNDLDWAGRKYPLSTQDLAAYDLVPELIDAGVSAFKIEGRLKTAEYVAAVTRHYRRAIDAVRHRGAGGGGRGAGGKGEEEKGRRGEGESERGNDSSCAGSSAQTAPPLLPFSLPPLLCIPPPRPRPPPSSENSINSPCRFRGASATAGSRGRITRPSCPGGPLARAASCSARSRRSAERGVVVRLVAAVKRGDGVVFEPHQTQEAKRASQDSANFRSLRDFGSFGIGSEQGGRVYEVFAQGRSIKEPVAAGEVELTFARGAIDRNKIRPGQEVRKTDDPQWDRQIRRTFMDAKPQRRVALDLIVEAAVGGPLRITGTSVCGAACRVESPEPLEEARKHPLTEGVLREQLGRLGNTAYELRHLDARIDGRPMIPLSVLGQVRRAMVEQLDLAAARSPAWTVAKGSAVGRLREAISQGNTAEGGRAAAELHVLCRSMEQIGPVLGCGIRSVVVDFPDMDRCREAVETIHRAGADVVLATPRIQKPGEETILKTLAGFGPDRLLVRNLGGLGFCRSAGIPAVADFSLNAANELTVHWLRQQGASRVTAAYDLDRGQIFDLAAAVPPEWLEVVVHTHVPMFHTEHCIFCAVLSSGMDRGNCGRPCRRHEVRLRDPVGMEHPVAAEFGCRNTVYHAVPRQSDELLPVFLKRGIHHFRVEFLEAAGPHEVQRVVERYRRLLLDSET